MSKTKIAINILCTGVPIMLTYPPEIITSNFGKWLELFGITSIPIWIHSQWFYNCMMSACFLWLVVSTINYFRPKTQPIIPIKIEKVVDYLTTKSLWSEQQYRKYNFRYFSKGEYPLEEIVDKARLGLITIKGFIPNTFIAEEIDKDYWKHATLKYIGSHLLTECNNNNRLYNFVTYDSLEIISPDIKSVWRPYTRIDIFYSRLLLIVKSKIYYPIKDKLSPTKPPTSY